MFTQEQEQTYKNGLVRFHQNTKVVGAGFYLEQGYILTCAHIVTQCLNLGKNPQNVEVTELVGQPISIDFPFVAYKQLQTALMVPELWMLNTQDLAILKLDGETPEGVEAIPLDESTYHRNDPYHVYGFPEGQPDGIWARGTFLGEIAKGWIQIEDTKAQGVAIEPGFSGAPVWNERLGAIAGMTVARDKDREEAKIGFMIPCHKLKPALEAITLFDLLLPEARNLEAHWRKAYHFVRPENWAKPLAQTLEEAILQVQDMAAQGSADRAIFQFVGYLALPQWALAIQPRLLQWLQNQVENVQNLLDTIQQKIDAQTARRPATLSPHLLFWVQAEANSDRYFAQAYLVSDRENYDPVAMTGVKQLRELAEIFEGEEDEKVSQSKLEKGLQLCLEESVGELTSEQDDLPPICIEVFLPRRCLSWAIDCWLAEAIDLFAPEPEPIGSRYHFVLRLADRLDDRICTRQRKALWKKKWSVLEQKQNGFASTGLICGDDKDPLLLQRELSVNPDILGWHRLKAPQSVVEDAACVFSVLVGTGATIALWLRQPLPSQEQVFSEVLNRSFSELIAHVSDLRRQAYQREDKSSPHIGEQIGLIWENPKLVPPGTVKPSRLRMPA